jgi:hypothetical protein
MTAETSVVVSEAACNLGSNVVVWATSVVTGGPMVALPGAGTFTVKSQLGDALELAGAYTVFN